MVSEHTLVRGDEERDWSSHFCMANSHKAFLQPPTLSHPKTSAVPWGLDLRQLLQHVRRSQIRNIQLICSAELSDHVFAVE